MVRFEKISVTEKNYPYVKAISAADYKNGTFGAVVDGVFTAGAVGFYSIINMEDGDDAKSDDFKVLKDSQLRVADFTLVPDGTILNITSAQLSVDLKYGDKMVSAANGALTVPETAPTAKYFEVIEITPYGCRAKVVK